MNILALETANDPGSVALWLDGRVVGRRCADGASNSATLLPLVRELLDSQQLDYDGLDGVAFGAGPGSFTGLRVACGVAQGIAVARGLPLLGVCTLEAMALAAAAPRVLVVLDARMGEVYFGAYRDGVLQGALGVCAPEAVPLPAQEPDAAAWLACGNGLSAYPALRERLAACVDAWRPEVMPCAEAVARLAAARLAAGEAGDVAGASPIYVRDKVAKTVAERLAEGGRA